MDWDRREMDRRLLRIAMIVGIIAAFIAMAVGIVGMVSAVRKAALMRNMEMETIMQDAGMPGEAKTMALMVDTRAKSGEKEGGGLIDILTDRQVYFAGLEDAVIAKDTEIFLENMEENGDILLQYEICDKATGEVLETTGLIPAGEHVAWTPGETMESGTYTLSFHEKPFYPYEGEYVALTQGNNEVKITIQ